MALQCFKEIIHLITNNKNESIYWYNESLYLIHTYPLLLNNHIQKTKSKLLENINTIINDKQLMENELNLLKNDMNQKKDVIINLKKKLLQFEYGNLNIKKDNSILNINYCINYIKTQITNFNKILILL